MANAFASRNAALSIAALDFYMSWYLPVALLGLAGVFTWHSREQTMQAIDAVRNNPTVCYYYGRVRTLLQRHILPSALAPFGANEIVPSLFLGNIWVSVATVVLFPPQIYQRTRSYLFPFQQCMLYLY